MNEFAMSSLVNAAMILRASPHMERSASDALLFFAMTDIEGFSERYVLSAVISASLPTRSLRNDPTSEP